MSTPLSLQILACSVIVIKPPYNTLRTTTCSYHIPPTLYNPTLAEYSKNLAEYGRTLRVVVDGILPYIAVYCPYIVIIGRTWQNIVEYGRRYALVLLCVLYTI